jgi:oligoendopeptidase F
MTNEEKGKVYAQLMFEHTKIQNKIASIKGESIEMNQQQINEIRSLERKLAQIMNYAARLY